MIDQNEYTKIDEYVKRKQVVDRSMSEELKAKTKSKISNNNNNNMGSQDNNSIDNSKNNENSLDPNNTNGHQSILEAATKQFEQSNTFNLNDVHLDLDDDEALDANFEAESDLSDGSEVEEVEEFDKEEEEEENDLEEISHSIINNQQHSINMDLFTSLKDIPIEIDDNDDDNEGSGVDYD